MGWQCGDPQTSEKYARTKQNQQVSEQWDNAPEAATTWAVAPEAWRGTTSLSSKFDNHNIVGILNDMCHDSKYDTVDEVFDDFESNIPDTNYFKSRMLLAATNEIADEVNDELAERILRDLHVFRSIDTVADVDNQTMFPAEYLNRLWLFGLP